MLSREAIANGLHRTVQTVDNWSLRPDSAPVYLNQALRALEAGLTPLDTHQMDGLNLVRLLGIPAGTERYWRMTGYPHQACVAAAWACRPPKPYHRTILRNIDIAGTYYRTRGNRYRARGRDLPPIKHATVQQLETLGYVIETQGRITLTTTGRAQL